jgi:hypothetical protein
VIAAPPIAPAARATKPWLWPNLLSLDAPAVAVLWQALFVRCFRARFDVLSAVLLPLTVWLIYSADRVLDAWSNSRSLPRHEFHGQHWRAILAAWIVAFAAAGWLAWKRLPDALFTRGLALLAIVAIYFAFVHLTPRRRWPKEFAVAILFAAGVSLAAWQQIRSAADIATVAVFCCLCWINCAAIDQWERRGRLPHTRTKLKPAVRSPQIRRSLNPLVRLSRMGAILRTAVPLNAWPVRAAAIALGLTALLLLHEQRPILGGAETLSAFAFAALDGAKDRLSTDALRVLADVALLTPLLFLPLVGLRP